MQGYVEGSNVTVVEELVSMIATQRLRAEFGDPDHRPDARQAGAAVMRGLCAALASAALGGCVTMNPRVEVAEPTYVIPAPPPPPPVVANGAIFQPAQYRPLFEDYRARHRGDTLNVQIVEKVVASQKSASTVDKSGSVDAWRWRCPASTRAG